MRSHLFHVVLAVCLVGGVWYVSHPVLHSQDIASGAPPTVAVQVVEADDLDVRTGDTFWGIHLDGVFPCSSMLVKGGGHFVTLTSPEDGTANSIFQVIREKQITLHGKTFLVRVLGADQIHVQREPSPSAVATTP